MTRMSDYKGVTAWLRRGRPVTDRRSDVRPTDVPVTLSPDAIIILPPAEDRALSWDAPPTSEERKRISVLPPPAGKPGTGIASTKRKRSKRA
jgi:hypothetical protein